MNDELVYGSEPTYRRGVVGWALVIALGLGMAWGLASVFSGWRLAWAAPLVGLAVAWSWRQAAWSPSRGTALGAAALLALSAGVAWGTATMVGRQHVSAGELEQDPGLVTSAAVAWMETKGLLVDPIAELEARRAEAKAQAEEDTPSAAEPGKDDAETQPPANASPPPVRPETQARRFLETLGDAEQQEIVAWYVNRPGGQAVRRETARRAWRWTDLIWVLAGTWLVFRLSSGRPDADEDEYDDD
ncbi:MAG: hypothetical protein AAGE65_03005 [Planctomycetota bacterium]